MSVLFQTDMNNQLIMPTFVLCHANQSPIDTIAHVEELKFNDTENNPCEISFSVKRLHDGVVHPLYSELVDFKLVYVPEWKRYYQIQVGEKDNNEGLIKTVVGKHLCEAELSQLMLYDVEINTENDILLDNYSHTVIYDEDNPKQSLLHRILNDKGLNYSIKYVSPSLRKLTRSFSINGQSIDDFLRNTLSEELNCIVEYDSTDRSISLYDTLKICANEECEYRGDYTGDTCPVCGSSDIYIEYGKDTGILISTKNLAQEISVQTNMDTVKTCFRVTGGDDKITANVRAVNPNGSNYIYNFSNEILADMPEELRKRIEEYNVLYLTLQPQYKACMQEIFENLDRKALLEYSMTPEIEEKTTTANELSKLTVEAMGNIGLLTISDATTVDTVNNAVLGVAQLQLASGYNVAIDSATFTYKDETSSQWSGKFKVSHYSNAQEVAVSTSNITLTVTNDYETFVTQKVNKTLKKKDAYNITKDWEQYSLSYLKSFESAYSACLNVLNQMGINNEDSHGRLCKQLYTDYFIEWTKICNEITVREAEIQQAIAIDAALEQKRQGIAEKLDFEEFLTPPLFKEFFHYRRDEEYNNSNYISDGLTDAQALKKAEELIEAASVQLYKASQTQYTITGTLANFLLMEEFAEFKDECAIGNWIYIQTQSGDVYKLRLNGISGNYSSIDALELQFSNAHSLSNPVYSLRDTILKASSMANSYQSVTHQASKGDQASQTLNEMHQNGLLAAKYRIVNADNQTVIIDEHGILGREWDDIEGTFSPEQVKIVNNLMCYTDDGWQTVKQAIGKITYKDPQIKDVVNKYGVIADTIIAADIFGSKFVGGDIYSDNYWNIDETMGEKLGDKGSHINLRNGTFTIANGFLTFDGEKLKITGDGTSLDISLNSQIKDIGDDIDALDDSVINLDTRIQAMPGEIYTEVSKTYATQETTNKLSTTISQKVDSITMSVKENDTALSSMTLGYKKVKVDGTEEEIPLGTIDFTGMVTFHNLAEPNETTVIHGGNIKTGKIEAKFINTEGLIIGKTNIDEGVIPASTSDLTNDSGFTTMAAVEERGYQTESGVTTIVGGMITTDYVNALEITAAAILSDVVLTNALNVGSKFEVDSDGNLKATNADITGTITATSGQIGDFSVGIHAATGACGLYGGGVALYPDYGMSIIASGSNFWCANKAVSLYTDERAGIKVEQGSRTLNLMGIVDFDDLSENAIKCIASNIGSSGGSGSTGSSCDCSDDIDDLYDRVYILESAASNYAKTTELNAVSSAVDDVNNSLDNLSARVTILEASGSGGGSGATVDLSSYATKTSVEAVERDLEELAETVSTLSTANYEIQVELIPDLETRIKSLEDSAGSGSSGGCDCDLTSYATQTWVYGELDDYVDWDSYNEKLTLVGTDVTNLQTRVGALEAATAPDLSGYVKTEELSQKVAYYGFAQEQYVEEWCRDLDGRLTSVESQASLNADYIQSIIQTLEEMGYQV